MEQIINSYTHIHFCTTTDIKHTSRGSPMVFNDGRPRHEASSECPDNNKKGHVMYIIFPSSSLAAKYMYTVKGQHITKINIHV